VLTTIRLPSFPSSLLFYYHENRTVANLSRPRDALERNIARRFAAACKHVRSGELCQLCDAGSIEPLQRSFNGITIEALQRSFNDIKMDAVSGYERVQKAPGAGIADDHVTTTAAEASCRCTTACDCQAFVATTPGAAGQAALLNLRHSFLWLKPSDASTDASQSILTDHDKRPNTVNSGSDDGDSSGDALHHESQQKLDADILVLEPDIKAHFVISRPTARYRRLMDALPVHFVGTHKRLVELVEFVCGQMLVSFRENGLSVPPWRKNKSILSKWPLPTVTSRSQPPTPTRTPSVFAGKGVSARQISGFGARAGANMCPQRQQQWQDGRQAGPLHLPANGHQQLHQPQHNDHDSSNQCLSATLALYRLEEMRLAQLPEKATTDITDGSLVRAPPGAGAQAA